MVAYLTHFRTPIAVAQSASGLCSKGPPEAHGLEYSSRMKVAIASTTAEAIIASILKNETKGNVDCAKNVATHVYDMKISEAKHC